MLARWTELELFVINNLLHGFKFYLRSQHVGKIVLILCSPLLPQCSIFFLTSGYHFFFIKDSPIALGKFKICPKLR